MNTEKKLLEILVELDYDKITSKEAQRQILLLFVSSSRLSFEEMAWNKRFPDEDFNADNFYDWAAENGKEAFYVCIDVARDLGF